MIDFQHLKHLINDAMVHVPNHDPEFSTRFYVLVSAFVDVTEDLDTRIKHIDERLDALNQQGIDNRDDIIQLERKLDN